MLLISHRRYVLYMVDSSVKLELRTCQFRLRSTHEQEFTHVAMLHVRKIFNQTKRVQSFCEHIRNTIKCNTKKPLSRKRVFIEVFLCRNQLYIIYTRLENTKISMNFKSKKRRPKPSRFVAHTPRVQGILCGIPKRCYRIPNYMQTDSRISFISLIIPLQDTFSVSISCSIKFFIVSILL